MRSFMFLAACALLAGLAACATLDAVDDDGDKAPKQTANQKAVDEIVGMITGGKKKSATEGEKGKGPVGGDLKTKQEEAKRKEEEAKKKALEKQQKYQLETKRTRAEMERDKLRILSSINDDKIERKYRFQYVEPETTTLSPEQLEAMRVEEEQLAERKRKYGDWAVKEDEKKRAEKERADREQRAQKYSTETKRARAEMERDLIRIRDFIDADKGERKHRFTYVEPRTTEISFVEQEEITTPAAPRVCKLTLKFPDGSSQVREYSPREQLAAVRLYVRLQNPAVPMAKIALIKGDKQFTGLMMKESFESLGLCPSSELSIKFN